MSEEQLFTPQFTSNDDGSIQSIHGNKTVIIHPDGSVSLRTDNIRKISIGNIIDLAAYSINRSGDLIIHQFAFSSGAEGELVYTTAGKIKTFQVRGGCEISLTNEGDMVLSATAPQGMVSPIMGQARKDPKLAH